jgi:hypothetical protein
MTATAIPWKKLYHTLGRLVVAKNPSIAEQLIQEYHLTIIPQETDYNNIPRLYERFCFIERLCNEEYKGPLYKAEKVDRRRVFIGAMLHLFQPHAYHHPNDSILLKKGFQRKLAKAIGIDETWLHRLIKEVIFRETELEEFRGQVAMAVKKLSIHR